MTTCITDHPRPYAQTQCPEPATSLVDGVPCCADHAYDAGIQGAKLVQLTPSSAMVAMGDLLRSLMPDPADDVCGYDLERVR